MRNCLLCGCPIYRKSRQGSFLHSLPGLMVDCYCIKFIETASVLLYILCLYKKIFLMQYLIWAGFKHEKTHLKLYLSVLISHVFRYLSSPGSSRPFCFSSRPISSASWILLSFLSQKMTFRTCCSVAGYSADLILRTASSSITFPLSSASPTIR